MKKYWLLILIIISGAIGKLMARSCDISNILLQPGGYYAFPFKDTLIRCENSCEAPWYNQLVQDSCPQKQTNSYYNNLLDNSCQQHFQFQILFYGCVADNAYNSDNKKISLADLVFSRPFQIQDINLASKLANDDKLSLPGPMPGFGNNRDQQYIALLAPSNVPIEAEQHEAGLNVSTLYHFRVPGTERLIGVLGALLPVRHQSHRMTFDIENGTLFAAQAIPPSGIAEQTTLTQFFNNFESVNDFFLRGVVQAKGLKFCKRQRITRIGDIVALAALDVGLCTSWLDALLVGVQFVFPSSNKQKGNVVWPIEVGNGGSYQFEPFVNMYVDWCRWVNPVVYAGARFGTKFKGIRRIPKLKAGAGGEPLVDTEVIIPPGFENYIVDPTTSFNEFDTKVLQFADQAVQVKVDPGNEFLFRLGNYMYDFLVNCVDLGVFYDVYVQGKEKLSVKEAGTFDTALLENTLRTTQHLISWRLGYTHHEYLEAYIGTQHVIAGKNVPQYHKIFASISAYF